MTWESSPRLAAVAGWIAFVGIAGGLIAVPTLIAGQPPTANTSVADAMAYFRHSEFPLLNAIVSVLVAGIPIVPFGLGLRVLASGEPAEAGATPRGALAADIAFLLLVATLPIYVVSSAIGAALTPLASGDAATFAAVHQLYQVLYNGSADVLEGAWIGAFSVAFVRSGHHAWVGWLGLALAASRWVKALVPISGMPEAIIPISGVLFLAWFLAVVIVMTRWARAAAPEPRTVAALA